MQQVVISPTNGADHHHLFMNSSPYYESKSEPFFSSHDQQLSTPASFPTNAGDFLSAYCTSTPSSPLTNSPDSDEGEVVVGPTTPNNNLLHLSRLALQYQEAADRYTLCLAHLADAIEEAEALRLENAALRIVNGDLAHRLAAAAGARANRQQQSAAAVAKGIGRLRVADVAPTRPPPAPMMTVANKLTVLPKSISVRSKGYLKTNNHQHGSVVPGIKSVSLPANVGLKVHVGVDSKKEAGKKQAGAGEGAPGAGLEFEVYNQGMFKTELCNKWEETGECPYGKQCQFAHGIGELRPVIRHPRYKTQVCKMVLAGDACPYGHRCHFRHAIAPSDRLLVRP